MPTDERKIIGRREKADFPEFGLRGLNVKIDSGAYTSAIHCCRIEIDADGVLEVIFLDPKDRKYTGEVFRFKKFSEKTIRSSNGVSERRYVVKTKIKFGKAEFPITISFTFRGDMRYPVLIGRKFLGENRFLIDPRKKNCFQKGSVFVLR